MAWAVGGGSTLRELRRDVGFLGLSFSGCVKCESRQSGRTLLARLGFAAISRRDLHCRVCGEEGGELDLRQASMTGLGTGKVA